MVNKILFSFILLIQCNSSGFANPLDKFFKSLGGQVNHSTPGAFHDQSAGYYTGGGYVMRQGNTVINPINISLPRIGVGCNSLDMYFGSMSFLKGEELIQMGKQIATGMPVYAAQLFLKTKAPQIENLVAQLRKTVQDMNNMMLNSCQASQQIVGGLFPKGTSASEQICMDVQRGGNNDWFGARKHCNDEGKVSSQVEKAQSKYKDLLTGEYNLVWHVLTKMPEYKDNHELAYFVMSITGTLISKNEGGRYRLKSLEPRADQKEFIAAYLKGGTTSQLACDETEKCLSPLVKTVTIQNDVNAPQTTMKTKIIHKIGELREKYISKASITEEDINFLNDSVNLPVYKYIQVSVAAGTPFMMQDAAEYIAASVLLTQFDKIMSEVIQAVDDLQKIQLEDTAIDQFKQNLQQARSRVQALLIGANAGSIQNLNQTIQAIERSIVARAG